MIDNGSIDDTKDISLSYKNRIMHLNYHYCAEPGLMAARHIGAEKAKEDILCYLDDDSMASLDWLTGIEESFLDDNVVIAGGLVYLNMKMSRPAGLSTSGTKLSMGVAIII